MKHFRRSILTLASLILVAASLLPAIAAHAADTNLVANASVETAANATTPTSWKTDRWGTNTAAFSYPSTGHTGSRSVRTDVTAYTNGDAKWTFNAVGVTPGHTYTFSDYYQSNVVTQIFAEYTKTGGGKAYEWLGNVPASAAWAQATFTFTVPADIAKVGIFHLVNSVGWLVMDDASVIETAAAVPAPTTSLVPNDSVEQAAAGNSSKPAGWQSEVWGTNNTSFEYLTEGHTGTRSVKTTVSNYSKGDSKWYFDPIAVTAGKQYTVQDYYKSSVATSVVLVSYDATNKATYTTLAATVPASASAWQTVTYNVTPSATTKKITIFHLIKANGWLQLDDLTVTDPQVTPPTPPATNLVANPSVETSANGTAPDNWANSKWGTNTATFSYVAGGHTGAKAVKAAMTAFTDGDAKWFFAPVAVTPGSTYRYNDYYQSTIATDVVLQYTNADNSTTYTWLGEVPASTAWSQIDYSFVVPATAQKLTVLHLISGVGSLTIDDALLQKITVDPNVNPVPNPSVEQGSATNVNLPNKWSTNAWGTNTAAFAYMNEGHTGTRSVKVTMSNFTDGDAKWMFEPVSLERGKSYRFSAWYKTNVTPHPVAMYTKDDGSVDYNNMPIAQPNGSADWQQYTDTFTVPTNVKSVSVFFYIAANGYVQTDDYSISPYQPTGFSRPLVSLTFDDGFEENVSNVIPVLNTYNFKSTQCFATQFAEQSPSSILAFRDAGHEICSHTVSHPFLTQLTDTDLDYELAHSQQVLRTMTGMPVDNFASPYGDYDARVIAHIKPLYRSHRSVDEGYNSKDNLDLYRIRVQNMTPTTSAAEFQSWLDYAKATNTWLVLVYHRVTTTDAGPFDTYVADFNTEMQALSASGITVLTYNEALNEVVAQVPAP